MAALVVRGVLGVLGVLAHQADEPAHLVLVVLGKSTGLVLETEMASAPVLGTALLAGQLREGCLT